MQVLIPLLTKENQHSVIEVNEDFNFMCEFAGWGTEAKRNSYTLKKLQLDVHFMGSKCVSNESVPFWRASIIAEPALKDQSPSEVRAS